MRRLEYPEIYSEIFDLMQEEGLKKDDIQPSFLRLETVLKNGESKPSFILQDNTGVVSETEKRLNIYDGFIALEWRLGIFERDGTAKDGATKIVESYVNEVEFTTTAGFTKAHLNRVFNSKLYVEKAGEKKIPGFDTSRFYDAPATQKTAAANRSSKIGSDSGKLLLKPQLRLSGSGETVIYLDAGAMTTPLWENTGLDSGGVLKLENRAVLYLYGYLLKNKATGLDKN